MKSLKIYNSLNNNKKAAGAFLGNTVKAIARIQKYRGLSLLRTDLCTGFVGNSKTIKRDIRLGQISDNQQ